MSISKSGQSRLGNLKIVRLLKEACQGTSLPRKRQKQLNLMSGPTCYPSNGWNRAGSGLGAVCHRNDNQCQRSFCHQGSPLMRTPFGHCSPWMKIPFGHCSPWMRTFYRQGSPFLRTLFDQGSLWMRTLFGQDSLCLRTLYRQGNLCLRRFCLDCYCLITFLDQFCIIKLRSSKVRHMFFFAG